MIICNLIFVVTLEVNKGPPSKISNNDTVKKDIRCLGQIYSDLLRQVDAAMTPCSDHLIRCMIDLEDECVPPSEAVFYHPFFWSHEEVFDFLLMSVDFYAQNPSIEKNSSIINLLSVQLSQLEQKNLQTKREAIDTFSKLVGYNWSNWKLHHNFKTMHFIVHEQIRIRWTRNIRNSYSPLDEAAPLIGDSDMASIAKIQNKRGKRIGYRLLLSPKLWFSNVRRWGKKFLWNFGGNDLWSPSQKFAEVNCRKL